MEPCSVDIEAKQIVRWLLEEEPKPSFELVITATRSYERNGVRTSEALEEAQLGDVELEDLSEICEIGLLEVSPQGSNGWILRIRVADDIGPSLPDDEPAPESDEEIDLATFYDEFFAKDRGIAEVTAEAEGPRGKASLTRFLDAILKDRHKRKLAR